MALDSARVVADEIDEAESLDAMPGQGSDDAIADLVERPIDADALNDGDAGEEPVDAETAPSESEENAAEAGAGNGSAIGTAESSSQADAASESETVETTTGESTDEATDASTADSADEAGTEPVDEPATESTDVAASEPADEPPTPRPKPGTRRRAETWSRTNPQTRQPVGTSRRLRRPRNRPTQLLIRTPMPPVTTTWKTSNPSSTSTRTSARR